MTTAHQTPPMTVRAPEDLLAVAPVVLGFTPTDSLVLLTFGPGSFHARVDLPPPDDPAARTALVEALVAPARHHGVRRAAVLVYTDDRRLARTVSRELDAGLSRVGVEVLDCLRADGGRWWPAHGSRRGVPEWGVPYDAESHPFAAAAVLDGRVTLPSREALAATLAPIPAEVAAVADEALLLTPPGPEDTRWWSHERRWAADLVLTHLQRRSVPTTAELARLVVGLGSLGLRDAVWAMTPPADRAEEARGAADFWTEVVRRCPGRWRAPAAALLAYTAWNSGNGALAWCAVDVAQSDDPTHTLSGLVADLLLSAVRPGSFDPALAFLDVLADPERGVPDAAAG